ncbi:PREDICTED: uncharacterized protein LOC108492202 [Lepidothrix coronata]|uniref:Uncharacterized protein LOC108492202 n=1 Tax=Lepidothrix coronata TaxID=321398 RepID=A0A6J0G8V8_9PASS|nr:PREDICTED: uncharacterized protein LOC108492202 [Lepidothrix coronata]
MQLQFFSWGVAVVAFVRRDQGPAPHHIEPLPVCLKKDPPLAKSDPTNDNGDASVILYLRKAQESELFLLAVSTSVVTVATTPANPEGKDPTKREGPTLPQAASGVFLSLSSFCHGRRLAPLLFALPVAFGSHHRPSESLQSAAAGWSLTTYGKAVPREAMNCHHLVKAWNLRTVFKYWQHILAQSHEIWRAQAKHIQKEQTLISDAVKVQNETNTKGRKISQTH